SRRAAVDGLTFAASKTVGGTAMRKNVWLAGLGCTALVPVLIALPSHSASVGQQAVLAENAPHQHGRQLQLEPGQRSVTVISDEGGPSWLGVETREVNADKVKELKLPAERGVVIGRVAPDSPAAKAGLKENDVITEVNGQRVEGATQFSRMIHETPPGRTLQLTVWRDGRAQTLSATLGEAEQVHRGWMHTEPGSFSFEMPEVEVPDLPDV